MKDEVSLRKHELAKKIGLNFEEVAPIFSEETLQSMLMSQIVGGDTNYNKSCTDTGCSHTGCSHNDTCTDNSCNNTNCTDGTVKPTVKPTAKPTPPPGNTYYICF